MFKLAACCLLAGTAFLVIGCKKKTGTCDSASVCMLNNTTDTLRYCWGCNTYSEKVAPGQQACRDVRGPVGGNSSVWVDFQTASGTRRILVDECSVEVTYR